MKVAIQLFLKSVEPDRTQFEIKAAAGVTLISYRHVSQLMDVKAFQILVRLESPYPRRYFCSYTWIR